MTPLFMGQVPVGLNCLVDEVVLAVTAILLHRHLLAAHGKGVLNATVVKFFIRPT